MSSSTPERLVLPYRGRRIIWGVIFPMIVTGAAFLLVFSWLPRLPDEVALHWGAEVNRTGPVDELLWTMGTMAVVSLVVLAVFALATGRASFVRRLVLGLAAGQSVFFAGLLVVPIAVQLDNEPGSVPEGLDIALLIVTTLALTAGAAAAMTAGRDPRIPAAGSVSGETIDLEPDERAVWLKRVTPAPKFLLWGAIAGAAYSGLIVWASWTAGSWIMLILSLLPVLLLPIMLVWEVRVDPHGLTARSAVGWPRLHIPADEVEGAQVRNVENPLGEFGGWGIRTSLSEPSGTIGVIIRGGEAIDVSRSGQRRVVITVNDAVTGTKLLNTKAERSRSTSQN